MLRLQASHRGLAYTHRRFMDEGLAPLVDTTNFPALDVGAYSDAEVAFGRASWQMRTLDEYRSQVGFTELLMELTELGLPFDVLGTCVRVVRDEAVHVELCRRMVNALGGDDDIPGEPNWVRSDKRLPLLERVLRTVVGSLCIGETLSTRTIAGVRDRAADPVARAVLTQLTKDESVHGRFGWYLLELMGEHMSKEERANVEDLAPRYIALCREGMLGGGGEHAVTSPFGALGGQARRDIFEQALARDVCAEFRRLGFRI